MALGGGTALLSYRAINEQVEAADRVTHTHVVLEKLETLRAEVLKAESARRGYILTRDTGFLGRFSAACNAIQTSSGELHMLTADNARQQDRLRELDALIRHRIGLLDQSLAGSKAGTSDTQEQEALTRMGSEETQGISDAIARMEDGERDLLRQRAEAARRSARQLRFVLVAGTLVSLGLILGVFAALRREIAERTQAEERLNSFFNVSADLLCIAGTDGYFKRLNPAWEKALGYSIEKLLSRPYLDFVHPDDVAATRSAAHGAAVTGVESFENRYRTKQGAYRWLNWNTQPEPQGNLLYAAARDVTESKAAAETLRRLNQELGERARQLEGANRELEAFTSSVSHDLRAPLRHADGFSRILLEEHAGELSSEGRRLLGRVRQATQQMGELVDDLLNLSRVSRREASPLVVDLNALAGAVMEELKPSWEGRLVDFRLEPLPYAHCDPGLMRQVFVNLLTNAVKFTRPREHALIEVGVADHPEGRALYVRDNGVGFSMKYAGKLFGIFQRLHHPEDFEGTGVGLVTVQRIIQKHRGRIWAEAEVDKGATFFFTLDGFEQLPAPRPAPVTGGLHAGR